MRTSRIAGSIMITVILLNMLALVPAAANSVRQQATDNLFLPLVMQQVSSPADQAIIIDHTTTDLSLVPAYYINRAKEIMRLSYGHTSHGSQIISGMAYLKNSNSLYDFNTNGAVQVGILSLADYTPTGDLGNPDLWTWEARTRTYLNSGGSDRNVVVWSWCGQVSGQDQQTLSAYYLTLMPGLEADYPATKFIYMTGHLDGTGINGNLYQRNNQIRAFVQQNHGILFDFADIESYDPDGNYYPDANDSCPWCQSYCDSHPGYCPNPSISCAHSHSLNCLLKARAFWWLLARLAGWDGTS